MSHVRLAAALATGVLLVAGLAACGASGDGAGAEPGSSVTPGKTEEAPRPGPSVTLPIPGDKTDPVKGVTVTIQGTVEAGVESGCLVLVSGDNVYGLFGGDPAVLRAGATVEITGHEVPNVMSFCQQGTPFQVESARAL